MSKSDNKRNRPYVNGHRDIIICPKCNGMFVNRYRKSCIFCKTGLKFRGEFVFEGDYYWDKEDWITYEELSKWPKRNS